MYFIIIYECRQCITQFIRYIVYLWIKWLSNSSAFGRSHPTSMCGTYEISIHIHYSRYASVYLYIHRLYIHISQAFVSIFLPLPLFLYLSYGNAMKLLEKFAWRCGGFQCTEYQIYKDHTVNAYSFQEYIYCLHYFLCWKEKKSSKKWLSTSYIRFRIQMIAPHAQFCSS